MTSRLSNDRAILFVFAHPDDESFSGAGTAMTYAAAGVRVVLVTATRGERGKTGDPAICKPEDLPRWREQELRTAAAVIGFDELHLLGYRDRELADAAPEEVRQTLVRIVRSVKPAVVLTFDPNGFNVHPDHVAISRFTSDAIAAAADPRWFGDCGEPHVVPRLLWTPTIPPWEAARLDRLDRHPSVDFLIDVTRWQERRIAALRAHRSQHISIDKYFFNQPDLGRVLGTEIWRQGWGPRLERRPEADLFAGIR